MAFNPFRPVNRNNAGLQAEAAAMTMMLQRGKFLSGILDIEAVNTNETQQQPFALTGSIAVPDPSFGATGEATVLTFKNESGFNSIITGIFWDYDPGISNGGAPNQNNWVQGDGQLKFQLRVDYRHVVGYMNSITRLGSSSVREKIDRGLPVLSSQAADITVQVALAALNPIFITGARIIAGVYGVKFPAR